MRRLLAFTILLVLPVAAGTQSKLPPDARRTFADPATYAPDLADRASTSELRDAVPRYTADRQLLLRFHNVQGSTARIAAQEKFADGWLQALAKLDFDRLSQDGKVDYILLANRIRADRQQASGEGRLQQQISRLVPFAQDIASLQEARQRTEFIGADAAVQAIEALTARVKAAHAALTGGASGTSIEMAEAAGQLNALRLALGGWFNFYRGYDPTFTEKVPGPFPRDRLPRVDSGATGCRATWRSATTRTDRSSARRSTARAGRSTSTC